MIPETQFTGKNFRRMLEEKVTGAKLTAEHWRVPSTTAVSVTYDVHVEYRDGLFYADCTCKAGQAKRGCKHGLWVLRQIYFDPWLLDAVKRESRRETERAA